LTDTDRDPRTPGRRAGAASVLASHDLASRVARLPLPAEARPRVVRFVEGEVERALENQRGHGFTVAEIEATEGGPELLEKLRATRADHDRATALREAGLADLPRDELEALVAAAREMR
jgi:hypothetical protein